MASFLGTTINKLWGLFEVAGKISIFPILRNSCNRSRSTAFGGDHGGKFGREDNTVSVYPKTHSISKQNVLPFLL